MGNVYNTSSSSSSSAGIGFLGALGIVFIVLKLCGVIDWSWWLVTLPIYGGFLLWLIFVIIFAIIAYITSRY